MVMNQNILFFDGVCHLCNGFVSFLVGFNSKSIFYSPLQGKTAAQTLKPAHIQNLDSVIYFKNGITFEKSSAVIEVLSDASLVFFWIKVFYIIPRSLRDLIYDKVADRRYRIFGKSETCRIPTATEKQFILE